MKMYADHVRCIWCMETYYVECGAETCPLCLKNGYMAWVDEETPEVLVEEDDVLEMLVCDKERLVD